MNKVISKNLFIKSKILTPKYFSLTKKEYNNKKLRELLIKKKINFPLVIKPINEGSSLGVKIIDNFKSLYRSSKFLFRKYNQLMFEKYIEGQEIQVAVINNNALETIELVPKRSFYDYSKYTKAAKTKHIMPARLSRKKLL